jgi:hypothetical protein
MIRLTARTTTTTPTQNVTRIQRQSSQHHIVCKPVCKHVGGRRGEETDRFACGGAGEELSACRAGNLKSHDWSPGSLPAPRATSDRAAEGLGGRERPPPDQSVTDTLVLGIAVAYLASKPGTVFGALQLNEITEFGR